MNEKMQKLHDVVQNAENEIHKVIIGQDEMIRAMFLGFFAGGPQEHHSHILLEGKPSLGKTEAAKAFAEVTDLEFRRFQFTPDILPTDVIGFHDKEGKIRRGAVFTNILLADEINRGSPKAQSALLEAMQEGQATIEGVTYKLPLPFFVIATMNPIEQKGTHPLTEAGVDRFTIKIDVDYPLREEEIAITNRHRKSERVSLQKIMKQSDVIEIRKFIEENIWCDPSIVEYAVDVIRFTRPEESEEFVEKVEHGVSLRGFWLARVAAVQAFLDGYEFILPDHVDKVAHLVLGHRIKVHWRVAAGQLMNARGEVRLVVQDAAAKARAKFLERS